MRMAGLGLAGGGAGALLGAGAGAAAGLPGWAEQRQAAGLPLEPQSEEEAGQFNAALMQHLGTGALIGTGVGAGAGMLASRMAGDRGVVEKVVELVQPPAESGAAERVARTEAPLLSSYGQRLAKDPGALKEGLRRIGQHYERGITAWDEHLPSDGSMTPAQVVARELRPVGDLLNHVSPQWLGRMVDAVQGQEAMDIDDPRLLALLGEHMDYNAATRNSLDAVSYLQSANKLRMSEPDFLLKGLGFNQVMTSAEVAERMSGPRRALNSDQVANWRFDDNAPAGFRYDLNSAAVNQLAAIRSSKDPSVTEEDKALAAALAYGTRLNDRGRPDIGDQYRVIAALAAQDLDGWLDYEAYRVHQAGQQWQEPEISAVLRDPGFYANFDSEPYRTNIETHNSLIDKLGVRGFRRRLRSGEV
jgi:hypothetical protein